MSKSCSVNRHRVMHSTILLFGLLVMAILKPTGAEVGVCYGMMADNLPPKANVIDLYEQKNIKRMRLYAPDEAALQALGGTGIKLLLDVPNPDLERVAASQGNAVQWVQDNVVKYGNVDFQYIAVGNEVKPSDSFAQFLFPAIQNIRTAIVGAGLGDRIKVSTATFSAAIDGFPPSSGTFRSDYQQLLGPVVNFLRDNQAPMLVNIYPYFAYIGNPSGIPLDYALFKSQSPVVTDGSLQYQNLFDAMVDSFYFALEKAGGGDLNIVVSESGWPSAGGSAEVTNVNNAMTYNTQLVQHVNNQGTPKKPGPIETYIFAMFDEKDKQGEETERHFGLFFPDGQPKYEINF